MQNTSKTKISKPFQLIRWYLRLPTIQVFRTLYIKSVTLKYLGQLNYYTDTEPTAPDDILFKDEL